MLGCSVLCCAVPVLQLPPPSPIPSSLPLRVMNQQQPGDPASVVSASKAKKKVDILMPSPFKPLPEPRVSQVCQ